MNPTRRRQWGQSLVVGVAAWVWHTSSAPAASLLVACNGFDGSQKTMEQNVRVTIKNGIAVAEVKQVFLHTRLDTRDRQLCFLWDSRSWGLARGNWSFLAPGPVFTHGHLTPGLFPRRLVYFA
jgi:hypothetical protein